MKLHIYLIIAFCLLVMVSSCRMAGATMVCHFKHSEFACHHCGAIKLDPLLIPRLEALRHALGDREIVITSGYRCPVHNRAEGGAINSQHLYGRAADVKVKGVSPAEVARVAKQCGFTWTKTYWNRTHIDIRK